MQNSATPTTRRKLLFLFFIVVGIFGTFRYFNPLTDHASSTKQISRYGTSPPVTPTEAEEDRPPQEPDQTDTDTAQPSAFPTTTGAPSGAPTPDENAVPTGATAPTILPTVLPPGSTEQSTPAPTAALYLCKATHHLNATGSIIFYNDVGFPYRWGNWLSPYWHNRALAHFGHYDFIWPDENFTYKTVGGDWLENLPNIVPRNPAPLTELELKKLKMICGTCDPNKNYLVNLYPHEECEAFYYFTDVIRTETRAAIEKHAQQKQLPIPYTRDGEAVYYDRCHPETFFGHQNHGPTGFSIFLNLPKNTTKLYWIFNVEDTLKQPICVQYRAELRKFLETHYPNMELIYAGNTTFHDFAMIVYAKFVILDTGTFGLMSALACAGQVYMPPFRGFIKSPGLPPNMHWFGQALIPKLAKQLGISMSTLPALWEWLRSN